MKHGVVKFVAVLVCFYFFSCKKSTGEASFYYWKTKVNISKVEKEVLNDLHVSTLYIRFFDVDISKETGKPRPVAAIDNIDSIPASIQIIPVVFITNRTFLNLNKGDIILLAKNVLLKINSIKNNYPELQFDCDWSGKTKENYFLFLEEVKKNLKKIPLSCTIRLHQVKYVFKTGIPPVNRGTLMFYNMGNVSDPAETNSIYNKENAEKYADFINGYPLALDAALPIFKWYVHYRNNAVIGLITKTECPDLNNNDNFSDVENSSQKKEGKASDPENNTKFRVVTDHLEKGIFYKTNDVLRSEIINEKKLLEAAKLLQQHLKQEDRKIIFYDLDENNINYYDKKTFKEVMAVFN